MANNCLAARTSCVVCRLLIRRSAIELNLSQLGLWHGDLSLQNLRFREDALMKVWPDAPVSVHEGVMGALRLKVGFLSLLCGLVTHSISLHPCIRARTYKNI